MSNRVRAAVAVLGSAAVIGGAALAIPTIAAAASPSPSPSASGSAAGPHGGERHRGAEQELTGATAAKVKAAVLAKLPGATVHRMSAQDPAEKSGAAYEAHVTKSDGSPVEVLLDKSFKVLSTKADEHAGRPGGRGPGGPHGQHGAEVALTGTPAAKVTAAVLSKYPGATVDRMSAEDPKVTTGAAYEAHARTTDGSHVEVLLDKNFKVLVTRTMPPHGG